MSSSSTRAVVATALMLALCPFVIPSDALFAQTCVPRVMYDRAHGQSPLSTRSILAGDMTGMLISENFEPVDANLLADVDILWLTEMSQPFTGVAFVAIAQWIDAGGCVMMSADDDFTQEQFDQMLDQVDGDGTGVVMFATNGTAGLTSNITVHGTTAGVTSVSAPSPAATFLPQSPAFTIVDDVSNDHILVLSDSPSFGRIVACGDRLFTDDAILSGDNRVLGRNLLQWLAGDVIYPPADLVVSPNPIDESTEEGSTSMAALCLDNSGGCELTSRLLVFAPPVPVGATLFSENFDDGDFSGWIDAGGTGAKEATLAEAANGSAGSYHESGSGFGHKDGIYHTITPSQPAYVGFWVRSGDTGVGDGYVVISDSNGDDAIFFYTNNGGRFSCNPASGGDTNFPYLADRWYFVQFTNIDFTAKTFDYYVGAALVKAGVSFRTGTVNEFARIDLYNAGIGGEAWWDEIAMYDAQPIPWLVADPDPGNVAGYTIEKIDMTLGTASLLPGTYAGLARAETDAASVPIVEVPLTLTVTPTPTGVGDDTPGMSYALQQNHPNPFNPVTEIPYELGSAEHIRLDVFDARGHFVCNLVNRRMPEGRFSVSWDGRDDAGRSVASGVYFYRLRVEGFDRSRKMILLK